MKTLFLVLLTAVVSGVSAQNETVSLAELKRLASLSPDEFGDAALKAGFIPGKETRTECTVYNYIGKKVINRATKQLSLTVCPGARNAGYTTLSSAEFTALKDQIKADGYKWSHEEPVASEALSAFQVYTKGTASFRSYTMNVGGTVSYCITFSPAL